MVHIDKDGWEPPNCMMVTGWCFWCYSFFCFHPHLGEWCPNFLFLACGDTTNHEHFGIVSILHWAVSSIWQRLTMYPTAGSQKSVKTQLDCLNMKNMKYQQQEHLDSKLVFISSQFPSIPLMVRFHSKCEWW